MLKFGSILKNSGWLVLEQVVRLCMAAVVSSLIARQLGPTEFGYLNIANNLVAILLPVAGLCLTEVVVRRAVSSSDDAFPKLLGSAVILRLIAGAIVCSGLLVSTCLFLPQEPWAKSLVILSFSLIIQAPSVFEAYFQRRLEHRFLVPARILGLVLGLIIKVLLILADASVTAYAASLVFDSAASTIATLWAVRKYAAPMPTVGKVDFTMANGMIKSAWPLVFSGVLAALYFRVEQFVVVGVSGEREFGIYAAAVRLATIPNLLFPAIHSSMLPMLAKATEAGSIEAQQVFRGCLGILTAASIVAAVLAGIGSWCMIRFVLGNDYYEAVVPALVLAVGIPAIVSGGVRSNFLLIINRTDVHTPSAILGIGVNFALATTLVPKFGLVGAAMATTVGAYMSAIFSSLLFPATRRFGVSQIVAFSQIKCLTERKSYQLFR